MFRTSLGKIQHYHHTEKLDAFQCWYWNGCNSWVPTCT
ncbi:hypothetical protein PanWU01x14_236940 [Parasponia andersonii]|uniref:Uncharacterized protein n=1 Tax=Parasponia andersonii TaxID=3476 RepID=A0A2P5BI71_PARAD|nr:hypothetical protein PanWU01x14_236940 [Parasponia andersonii]